MPSSSPRNERGTRSGVRDSGTPGGFSSEVGPVHLPRAGRCRPVPRFASGPRQAPAKPSAGRHRHRAPERASRTGATATPSTRTRETPLVPGLGKQEAFQVGTLAGDTDTGAQIARRRHANRARGPGSVRNTRHRRDAYRRLGPGVPHGSCAPSSRAAPRGTGSAYCVEPSQFSKRCAELHGELWHM